MTSENCIRCRFWIELREGEGVFSDGNYNVEHEGAGRCRRFPPMGFREPMPLGAHAIDAAAAAQWAVTYDGDWCGEFEEAVCRNARPAARVRSPSDMRNGVYAVPAHRLVPDLSK